MIIGSRDGIDLILIVQDSKNSCSLVGTEFNFHTQVIPKVVAKWASLSTSSLLCHFLIRVIREILSFAPSSLNSCSPWSLGIGVQIGENQGWDPQTGCINFIFFTHRQPTSGLAMGAMYMD